MNKKVVSAIIMACALLSTLQITPAIESEVKAERKFKKWEKGIGEAFQSRKTMDTRGASQLIIKTIMCTGFLAPLKLFFKVSKIDPTSPIAAFVLTEAPQALEGIKFVKYVVKKGIDVNIPDYHGRLALNAAAWDGDIEIVEYLVKNGANINKTDKAGKTALQNAKKALKQAKKDKNKEWKKDLNEVINYLKEQTKKKD